MSHNYSWEPIENLAGCESLIAAFRKSSEDAEAADLSIRAKRKAERAAEQEAEVAAEDDSEWKDGAKVKRKAACCRYFMCKFSEIHPEKIESVYCKICGPDFTVEHSGNTSNMRSHLAHVHKQGRLRRNGFFGGGQRFLLVWVGVCRKRAFSICEDEEFRDIFNFIFQGGYVPPCHKLVTQNVLTLSVEGRNMVTISVKDLLAEKILPSIAGDIWSDGGIAIFGILVYWLTVDGKYMERLLCVTPRADEIILVGD
ncbi:hypothetical protein CYMTET_29362 [Cymbomonas tetramitiformis]|uniref:BED-type domain-containing protein n=1 Tax=Cymbomonas tetramitiformis TaxID=36881 RepID=A0AAE0FL76_9CHLO|nr:hypothetical protein CYMTET_29362 [Cymbomonas tetramitiformis]